jgi:hypothetical protein
LALGLSGHEGRGRTGDLRSDGEGPQPVQQRRSGVHALKLLRPKNRFSPIYRLERLAKGKHFSLSGPLISGKGN